MTKKQEIHYMFYVSVVLKLNYWHAPRTQTLPYCNSNAASFAADSHRRWIIVDQQELKACKANHLELRGSSLANFDKRVFSLAS
jgi:hypothetical protein